MQIPAPAYRCPLGPMQPERPDLEAVKREGWQSQRILVVSDADPRLDSMHLFGYVDANECFHEVSPLQTTRQLFLADFALHSDGSRSLISGRKGRRRGGDAA